MDENSIVPPTVPAGPDSEKKAFTWRLVAGIVALVFLIIIVLFVIASLGSSSDSGSNNTSNSSQKTAASTATKLVDPCVLLSPTVFKTVTGVADNSPAQRTMPSAKSGTSSSAPVGECLRKNKTDQDLDIKTKTIDLVVYYNATATAAKQYVSQLRSDPAGSPGTAVQTTADEAYVFAPLSDSDLDGPIYTFRVGSYLANLTITSDELTASGTRQPTVQGTQDQYIEAINLLTAQMHTLGKP